MKKKFPIFSHQPNLVYLDSAATSQLPASVILDMNRYLTTSNANIHRGQYSLSLKATALYEELRQVINKLLKLKNHTVIITSGTTNAIAQIVYGLKNKITKGDTVLVAQDNHHANFVGWQRLCQEQGAKFVVIPINKEGRLDIAVYKKMLLSKPKVVAISHVSNVTGVIHPIKQLCALAAEKKAITVVDGAQAIAHTEINVSKIDCDFYVFSGHKLFGPTGIGALVGRTSLLEQMEPIITGGGMINEVTNNSSTWAELPGKLEPGTPNVLGAVGLASAIKWWMKQDQQTIITNEQVLTKKLLTVLNKIEGLKIVGPSTNKERTGTVSFYHRSVHAHDLAEILANNNIAVRAGHHCAMPLHNAFAVNATLRVSFGPYNTNNDVNKLVSSLKKAIKLIS